MKTAWTKLAVTVVLVSWFVLGLNPIFTAAQGQRYVINWLTLTDRNATSSLRLEEGFMQKVTEASNGRIVFNFIGGQEVIPQFDQGEAVQRGIVDLAMVPVGFYESLVPGIGGAMLREISLEDERRPGGAYDFLASLHAENGLLYLGRTYPVPVTEGYGYFRLLLNERFETPEDFKGALLGTATVARPAVEAWGARVVSMGIPDYYTALERGMVVGIASVPLHIAADLGLGEVARYLVDTAYYDVTTSTIMNLRTWQRLPEDLRELMIKHYIEYERWVEERFKEDMNVDKQRLLAQGIEVYQLPPETEAWLLRTAREAAWSYQEQRFPGVTQQLRELLVP